MYCILSIDFILGAFWSVESVRCDRELKDKDITNKIYTPQARIEGKGNHASEGRNIVSANEYQKSWAKKSNCNRVHPTPTADTAAFAKASKTVQIVRSVASYISNMKHSKQQPKTLEDQYDSALERLYLKEWPDAVPKHEIESCCSQCSMVCSSEWDSKSRKMFKEVFPSYIFYFLVFTGTLPARRKACHYIIKIFWILWGGCVCMGDVRVCAWYECRIVLSDYQH